MVEVLRIAKRINIQYDIGNNTILPSPVIYSDQAATNEYNAATISGIVFGIFMALLALYTIWHNSLQFKGIEVLSSL